MDQVSLATGENVLVRLAMVIAIFALGEGGLALLNDVFVDVTIPLLATIQRQGLITPVPPG